MTMPDGRYRLRTWLRGRLPSVLAVRVPKGRHDCGAHEWYRADRDTWRCYHCEPGIAHASPWTREGQLQHALGGIRASLRALALKDVPSSEEDLAALRLLVGEALAVMPEEERRLQRLASAPAAELSALVNALQAG